MADTVSQQCVEINTFHPADEILKDIARLDLAPGGGLLVWSNLQHGMCILDSLPTSAGQLMEFQQIEDNYREI